MLILKNSNEVWGGSSGKRLGIWIGMILLSSDPFFPLNIGNFTKRFDKGWLDEENELLTTVKNFKSFKKAVALANILIFAWRF